MEKVKLTDLIDLQILQNIQDAFSSFTELAALITDENGVPITKGSRFSGLCDKLVRGSEQGCKNCAECDRLGAVRCMENGRPSVYDCHAGLMDIAVPITVAGKLVGSFVAGQVRTHERTPEELRRIAGELQIDEEAFIEETQKVRLVKRGDLVKIAVYQKQLGEALSDLAYQNYLLHENSRMQEEAAISRSYYMEGLYTDIARDVKGWTAEVTDVLERGDTEEWKRILREMKTRGNDVIYFVQDTLNNIRQKNMSLNLSESVYSLEEVIAEVSESLLSSYYQRGNSLNVEIGESVPKRLFGDTERIYRVLTALLYEAGQNTEKGEIKLHIEARKQEYATMLEIRIENPDPSCRASDYGKISDFLQHRKYRRAGKEFDSASDVMRGELAIVDTLLGQLFGGLRLVGERDKGGICYISFPQLPAPEENQMKGAGSDEKRI